jgi:hypothetical protein
MRCHQTTYNPVSGQLQTVRKLIGSVNTSAFLSTNPTDELITSGLLIIRPLTCASDGSQISESRPPYQLTNLLKLTSRRRACPTSEKNRRPRRR